MKFVSIVVLAFSMPALAGDIVVLVDGRSLGAPRAQDQPTPADFAASNVTLIEENLDGVVYRVEGIPTKQSMPRAQVKRVVHDPSTSPPELAAALALLAQGKFDEGRVRLTAIAKNGAAPAWAQAEAAFRRAESFATAGDAAAAERALADFVQERTKSRLVIDAKRLRARMLVELGRDAEAKAEIESTAAVPGATDDEMFSARFAAAWIEARAALSSGDPKRKAAAAKTFDDMRPRVVARAAQAARCDVARAACGVPVEGLAAIVAASDDRFVLAIGNVLVADDLRRHGVERKDRAALEEAQERCLRVVLLYRDVEGAADFVAAAQFHAAEAFVRLAPDDAAGGATARARARREWEDLIRSFPKSEWAKRARTALTELQ